jgi:hypothetical protein
MNEFLHQRGIKLAAKALSSDSPRCASTHPEDASVISETAAMSSHQHEQAAEPVDPTRSRPTSIHHRAGVAIVAPNGVELSASRPVGPPATPPLAEIDSYATDTPHLSRVADATEQEPFCGAFSNAHLHFERSRRRSRHSCQPSSSTPPPRPRRGAPRTRARTPTDEARGSSPAPLSQRTALPAVSAHAGIRSLGQARVPERAATAAESRPRSADMGRVRDSHRALRHLSPVAAFGGVSASPARRAGCVLGGNHRGRRCARAIASGYPP